MRNIIVLTVLTTLLKLSTTQEIKYKYQKCSLKTSQITAPWEKWPTDNKDISLCAEPIPYNDYAIESALKADPDLLNLLNTLVADFHPMPYEDPVEYDQPENFVCDDICPGKYRNATAVKIREKIIENDVPRTVIYKCNIVRPWEQVIPFMTCLHKTPRHVQINENSAYYCVPNSFVEREIVIYCADRANQCMSVRMKVPFGCTCANLKCRGKEIIKRKLETVSDNQHFDFLSLLLTGK